MKKDSANTVVYSLFTQEDITLFKEGRHRSLYRLLGSRLMEVAGKRGAYFAVWAPNAKSVSVIGDFNDWLSNANPLFPRWDSSGIWEGFIPGIIQGNVYKYEIISNVNEIRYEKGDPFAYLWEPPPRTASIVWNLDYNWKEDKWLIDRVALNSIDAPMAIYEMHFESWKRKGDHGELSLTYREMALELPEYLKDMGFTHVEFMPLMEYPFGGSWGYQTTGYFAPTARFGTPQDFMYLIETLHREGIGVILDWVPSHFPADSHGLALFDGTHLFEHEDVRQGFHPDWKSSIFNYDRHEVRSFLISSALFWMEYYHVDGLRIDGVASMLYLDYSRKQGEWIPNIYGGNENLGAIEFLRQLNCAVYEEYPYAQTFAEESTAWPMVSRPTYLGGLGFGLKWNMGWMHDTLEYFKKAPIYRKYHQNDLTFSLVYAFNENFVLPLSHDEVVHGKASLLSKMPGDDWQKFANLRLLLGYLYVHPGKKLLFMGAELAQWDEWSHCKSLDWHLLQYERHASIQRWVKDLNSFYQAHPALYENDFSPPGFEWIDFSDANCSVISFLRWGHQGKPLLCICNFTPETRENYKIGVPFKGFWNEVINSDSTYYGGSDKGNYGGLATCPIAMHGRGCSLNLTLPPLSLICLEPECYTERLEKRSV